MSVLNWRGKSDVFQSINSFLWMRLKNSFKFFSKNILSSYSQQFTFWNLSITSIRWSIHTIIKEQSLVFNLRHMTLCLRLWHFWSNRFKRIVRKFFKLIFFLIFNLNSFNWGNDLNLVYRFSHKYNWSWLLNNNWFFLNVSCWRLNISNLSSDFWWR